MVEAKVTDASIAAQADRAAIYEARAQISQCGVGPIARPIITDLCDRLERRIALAALLARTQQGYVDAFYELAKLMDIGARAKSSADVWRTEMLPRLAAALARSATGLDAAWPKALTPGLRDILRLMCFQLGGFAHVYQDAGEFVGADGEPLKTRAEDEQAFMLHKLVGFYAAHGDDWTKAAQADLNRVRALKRPLAGGG